ncbi:MaoC family dehydratase [Gordonia insulae]|uniref:Putative enoyl-CoA hydratase 1 n=1 Tax=Gordonia insulae TaxID=2420509 RepID=A0A3G8JMM2_9ACTN|nr:MaoC family dehydratase [Gordonia insulae]AZG45440.1 putative enoyl-CoA hydratase 1 [Gordonia insulae]
MSNLLDPGNEPAHAVVYRGVSALKASVGQKLGPTDWLLVDQSRIDSFADDTEDHQWIHVDPDRAADGPFGGTIAHGFLTLSLVPHFINQLRRVEGVAMGVNYGLDRVRFPSPLRAGSRIRATTETITVDEVGPGIVQVVTRTVVEAEGAPKPVCVADLVARYHGEDAE